MKKQLPVRVDEKVFDALKNEAETGKTSLSKHVNTVLTKHVEKQTVKHTSKNEVK